jgi:hypothetical protein
MLTACRVSRIFTLIDCCHSVRSGSAFSPHYAFGEFTDSSLETRNAPHHGLPHHDRDDRGCGTNLWTALEIVKALRQAVKRSRHRSQPCDWRLDISPRHGMVGFESRLASACQEISAHSSLPRVHFLTIPSPFSPSCCSLSASLLRGRSRKDEDMCQ